MALTITNLGQARIENAIALNQKLNIKEIAVGSKGDYTPTGEETSLKQEVYRNVINESSYSQDQAEFQLVIPVSAGILEIAEIGLFDESGVLIALEVFDNVIHKSVTMELSFSLLLNVSNPEDAIEVVIDPSKVLATKDYVTKKADEHNQDIDAHSNLPVEPRYSKTITIGGSIDYLYPVWWKFPSLGSGKLTISRSYAWNGNENERPLNPDSFHQASLLLELEGNAHAWHGNANFMDVKRFYERFNNTCSHLNFTMWCKAEKINPNLALYSGANLELAAQNYQRSGCYLRGGGLTYSIVANWDGFDNYFNFHDGSDQLRRVVNEHSASTFTVRWYAEPILFSSLISPTTQTKVYL